MPTAPSFDLSIFDARGKLVRVLIAEEVQPVGDQVAVWNGLDDAGRKLPSGVYLCRLWVDKQMQQRKVVLLK